MIFRFSLGFSAIFPSWGMLKQGSNGKNENYRQKIGEIVEATTLS